MARLRKEQLEMEVRTVKRIYDVSDVMELLSLPKRTVHTRIKSMNDELMGRGFWIERGKVPIQFFHEKYPYIQKGGNETICNN